MTVGEQDVTSAENDRTAVRSLRRASGIPAPVRLPSRQPVVQSPESGAAGPMAPPPELATVPPVEAAAADETGVELVGRAQLSSLMAVLTDPREVSRQYKDDHELGGSKTDTFTLPVELLQTLNRVCKERRVIKKWLVAALLEAVFEAWGEEIHPD